MAPIRTPRQPRALPFSDFTQHYHHPPRSSTHPPVPMRRAVAATTASAAAVNVRDTRAVFAEVVVSHRLLLVRGEQATDGHASLLIQGEQALRGRPISVGPLLKTTDKFAASVAEK
jgi:predicted solute-binding protein